MIRLVRPVLCGGSVGLLAAAATAALLSRTDRIELSDKALVVAIVAAVVAIGWWTLGAIRHRAGASRAGSSVPPGPTILHHPGRSPRRVVALQE